MVVKTGLSDLEVDRLSEFVDVVWLYKLWFEVLS